MKEHEHNYENCHNLTCRRRCQKDGYNMAIDEFAKAFKKANITNRVFERIFHMMQFGEIGFHNATSDIDDMYCALADEVAQQLKEGGK